MNRIIKKLTAFILISVLACPIISMAGVAAPVYAAEIGDVNESGAVDASDALLVLQHVVRLTILPDNLLTVADTNIDGAVDASDALEILRYTVKLIPCFKGSIDSPAEALQVITDHVKNYGIVDEATGVRYIYEWYYDDSDPSITYNWIPEVDYDPSTGELSFHLAYAYDDPSDSTSYFDNVKMTINGNTASADYYIFITDANENILSEGQVSTSFTMSSVTAESTFSYQAVYPEDMTIDADWQALADEGIHFALEQWDVLLQSRFNMTIQDLGFASY